MAEAYYQTTVLWATWPFIQHRGQKTWPYLPTGSHAVLPPTHLL